jgi:hypothetical protein
MIMINSTGIRDFTSAKLRIGRLINPMREIDAWAYNVVLIPIKLPITRNATMNP